MNLWTGTGRLVKDPELTETQTGKKFVNFTVAVPKQYNKSQADFIDCQVWNKSAEYLVKYGKKGMRIEVQGPIVPSIYEEKKYSPVIATSIDLVFENNDSNNNNNNTNETQEATPKEIPEEDRPF